MLPHDDIAYIIRVIVLIDLTFNDYFYVGGDVVMPAQFTKTLSEIIINRLGELYFSYFDTCIGPNYKTAWIRVNHLIR